MKQMVLARGTKRRLVIVGAVAILLLLCGLGVFLAKQWAEQPVYPDAVPYGEVKGCSQTALVSCHSDVNFYTYDTPETVNKYFRDKGLHLVSYGASRGRPTFLYLRLLALVNPPFFLTLKTTNVI